MEVSRTTTCEALCGLIAAELDVADARVVLRDRREGEVVSLKTTNKDRGVQGLRVKSESIHQFVSGRIGVRQKGLDKNREHWLWSDKQLPSKSFRQL